jgi:hypothetical protein
MTGKTRRQYMPVGFSFSEIEQPMSSPKPRIGVIYFAHLCEYIKTFAALLLESDPASRSDYLLFQAKCKQLRQCPIPPPDGPPSEEQAQDGDEEEGTHRATPLDGQFLQLQPVPPEEQERKLLQDGDSKKGCYAFWNRCQIS